MSTNIVGKDAITGSNDPVLVSSNNLHVAQYVWDTNTLSWIKQTGSSGGTGTDVVVTNFPSTQNVNVVNQTVYCTRYDVANTTTSYLGHAAVGSNGGSSVWRIQRLTFGTDGDVTVEFADGNTSFDNVWDNRTSLSYS